MTVGFVRKSGFLYTGWENDTAAVVGHELPELIHLLSALASFGRSMGASIRVFEIDDMRSSGGLSHSKQKSPRFPDAGRRPAQTQVDPAPCEAEIV